MGLTASQIRQDFNCFGEFGQQGYGYNVSGLRSEIGKILGLECKTPMILLGAGNLGRALASHIDFQNRGFELVGIFDASPEIIGGKIGDITINDISVLEEFCAEHHPQAAILCIPKTEASRETDRLIRLGIRAFWNFTHYDLRVDHKGIAVENVHLGDSLTTLSYGIKSMD